MITDRFSIVFLFSYVLFSFIYPAYAQDKPEDEFNRSIKILLDKKSDPSSILESIDSLEKLRDQRAVPYLIKAVEREDFPSVASPIHASATIGGEEATNFLLRYRIVLEKKIESAISHTDRTDFIGRQAFTIAALYKLGHKEYIDFVYKAAKSKNDGTRYHAAHALGLVKNKKSRDILFQILKHDNMELPRCGAAGGLLEQKNKDILNILCRMIKKKEVDLYCLEDIGKIAKELGLEKGSPCDNIDKYFIDFNE
jgi:HEAT repeat protein